MALHDDLAAFAAALPKFGSLLALDVSKRRIGFAGTDVCRLLATPVETWNRRKFADDLARIERHMRNREAVALVVGFPLNADGSFGPRAQAAKDTAKAIDAAPGLKFAGLQAYQGAMQHMDSYEDRKAKIAIAVAQVKDAVDTLKAEGIECDIVGGGGTGSYYFESNSGVYNELQCGSYAFMDADYGRILDKDGKRIDQGEWENAMFLLTQVMSHAKPEKAIVDAGLKAQSVDSGLPVIFGRTDVEYVKCSDEHGVVADPDGVLKVGEKLRLVPGHCDPTANVHDWYVGVRNGKVETLWPVSARGKAY